MASVGITGKYLVRHWRVLDGWVIVKHDRVWFDHYPLDTVEWWFVWIRWGKPSYPKTSRRWKFKLFDVKFEINLWNRKRRAADS